nr:dual specificity protein phosphatase 12-like [Dermacentor andersoni]
MSAEAGDGDGPQSSLEPPDNPACPKSIPLCSLVEDGLYLGGRDAAEDEELIHGFGITHVLTVDTYRLKFEGNVVCLYLYAEDRAEEDLLSRFHEACEFIEKGQQNGACLVHCRFGVSRSATLVAAHLMRKYALDYAEALHKLKERRACIGPNAGFVAQLKLFQKMGYKVDKADLQFKLFLLERLSHLAKKAGSFYAVPCEVKSFWTDQDKSSGECLRCRKCRFTLCFTSKIVPHTPGYSIAWWDTRWKEPEERLCQTSIFVEPTAWLFNQARALQGRLTCPNCHGKLGNYNWSGLYCECGACAQPGFHITPSKVDRAVGASEPVKAYLRHRHRPATSECGPAYSRLEEEPDDRETDPPSTYKSLQDEPDSGNVELISACCQLEKQPECDSSEQVCACSQLEDEQHDVHSFESALVANLHESNEEQHDGRGGEHPRTN